MDLNSVKKITFFCVNSQTVEEKSPDESYFYTLFPMWCSNQGDMSLHSFRFSSCLNAILTLQQHLNNIRVVRLQSNFNIDIDN